MTSTRGAYAAKIKRMNPRGSRCSKWGGKKRATTNLDRFAVRSHSEMLSREPKFARRWWWIGANAPLADERGTLERGDEQKK